MAPITSTRNPIVARFRAAAAGDAPGEMLVEGVKLVAEALAAGLQPLAVAYAADAAERQPELGGLVRRLEAAGAAASPCADHVVGRLSSLTTSPGLAAVFARPQPDEARLLAAPAAPLLLVAAGIRDPGNLGAVLRVAEAAGVSGVIALGGGADPYRDKAVRAAAGSLFRLPVLGGASADAVVALAARRGLQLMIAAGDGELDFAAADLRPPTALVLGSEAHGVPPALRRAAVASLRIPMAGQVESLNVAVSAGVLLYEVRRQRQ